MVERLWVPLTQRLVARNWNLAMSGLAFTASRVANSVAVSTPLRVGNSVVFMSCDLRLVVSYEWMRDRIAGAGAPGSKGPWVRSSEPSTEPTLESRREAELLAWCATTSRSAKNVVSSPHES